MSNDYVLYEKKDNIATLTFNKPDKLNSYSFIGRGEDAKQIYQYLDQAANDDDVKVVILRGSGRAFGVGHDLSKVGFVYGMGTGKEGERRPSQRIRLQYDRQAFFDDMMNKLFLHPKITIAQVHGYCAAGGAVLMTLCDLAIAASDSKIGFSEQRLGPAGSSTPNMPILIAMVGLRRALDLLLTGKFISGEQAERIGLVNMSVPVEKLEEEVLKLAHDMTLLPRDGIALGKATRHVMYDTMGLTSGFAQGYLTHAYMTNLRWEPEEYNFFKERRDKGTKAAFHGRDDRYKQNDKS